MNLCFFFFQDYNCIHSVFELLTLSGFIFTYLSWSLGERKVGTITWQLFYLGQHVHVGGRIDRGDHTAFHCLHQNILGDA